MPTGKLERYREVSNFENVFEHTDYDEKGRTTPKGCWNEKVFENDNPIILELACGKGEYALKLSAKYPEKNIVGVDIKGARIWKGAKQALEKDRNNIRFLRIYIGCLEKYFASGEVGEIWIIFPDPYPRGSNRNKRLSSPRFLDIYANIMQPNGSIHLKTDSRSLVDYTRKVIQKRGARILDSVDDIYRERPEDELLTHKTYFEKKHLRKGRTISYLKFGISI